MSPSCGTRCPTATWPSKPSSASSATRTLDAAEATIEEREEYEPHLAEDNLVFAGVDYAAILDRAAVGGASFPRQQPLEVVELEAIRALFGSGAIVVACGGGGIPAARRGGHLAGLEAVIDKDRASALLAHELGADRLVILTEVPAVYAAFGTKRQEELRELSVDEAEELLPGLAVGSMRPKVEASVEFVHATGTRR